MKKCNKCILLFQLFLSVSYLGSCDELPEGVSISDIPNYYYENHYLENRAKVINDAIEDCSGVGSTFFWITDMHWEPDLNARKSPLLIKYLAQ